MKFTVGAVVFVFVFQKALALQCWKCSSDIDSACRDPFNEYGSNRISRYDNGQNYNQRQYDVQRQYDNQRQYNGQYNQNYNRQYDPNYNRQYDANYNPGYSSVYRNDFSNRPNLELCDENEARNRRMKNVCLKEIVRGNSYVSVVRRCELVPYEQTVGTCTQGVNRGLLLDFCEYCDYDGCNSAYGLRTNILLIAAISSIVLFLYH